MIESARLFCADGKNFSLVVVVNGQRLVWPLSKARALHLMESGMEALRISEEPSTTSSKKATSAT